MKKKILLMLTMMALLACVFVISVSATYIYRDRDGNELFRYDADNSQIITSYEGSFSKTDAQGNALTWYVTGTSSENGNTIKTVASVLTLDENYATLDNGTYSYKTNAVNTKNVVSVYFPSDKGITTLNLANDGYKNSNYWDPTGTEILFVYLPATLTTLPDRIVQGSKALVCEMPSEMPIETISKVSFYEAKCLREVNIPSSVILIDGESVGEGAAFYNTTSLERVTFGSNDNLETIGTMAFHKSGLKYITIPDSVKTIGQHAFSFTQLVTSPFTEKSRLETVGGRAFGDISTLQAFIVPSTITSVEIFGENNYNDYGPLAESTIQLVTFGNADTSVSLPNGFFGRAKITKIVFADWITAIPSWYFVTATIDDVTFGENVETVGERVFQGANVNKIRLGAGFKYFTNSIIDHHSFTYGANSIEEIYIPASFYAQAPETTYQVSYAFECGKSSDIKFFYTGTKEQLATSMYNFLNSTKSPTDNNGKFTEATQISWADYSANPDNYASGNYIIYDYNKCDAFYEGEHGEAVNVVNCVGECQRCGASIAKHEGTESLTTTIVYTSYTASGTKTVACTNDGCTYKETITVPAIFICLGYSAPEDGKGGIAIGFTVNNEAIKEYTEATGKTLKYGVFAVLQSRLGDNDIFGKDGTQAEGSIIAEISSYKFASFELKITGFETNEHKAL
ncbi:MAG: leucine-rich repeat protein, partial [Clostridia bacterium]|nr:leucine-rich repeat protein [Clostridia bacterium]